MLNTINSNSSDIKEKFKHITLAHLKAEYTVLEDNYTFSNFTGPTIRGAIGIKLKNRSCYYRDKREYFCNKCDLITHCQYYNMYEAKERISPYIISPPNNGANYQKNENFTFNLTLLGKERTGFDFYSNFLPSLIQIRKLARCRVKFKSLYFRDIKEERERILSICVDNKKVDIYNKNITFSLQDMFDMTDSLPDRLFMSLDFDTATHLKLNDRDLMAEDFNFYKFFFCIKRRIQQIAGDYCNVKIPNNFFTDLLTLAENNDLITAGNTLQDIAYNKRKFGKHRESEFNLYGFTGEISFIGSLKPFLPYILFCQYAGIGKQTTFGQGKYRVFVKNFG